MLFSNDENKMRVKLWGVRGSLPSPQSPAILEQRVKEVATLALEQGLKPGTIEFESWFNALPPHRKGGYGGNTPCIEVRTSKTRIIVDAGSGLRALGAELMQGPCGKGQGEVHLLFTHFHWDHLAGLPFFIPIFVPGNTIHLYGVQPDLDAMVKMLFHKPYFPVEFDKIGAKVVVHTLQPREKVTFGDIQVTPYQLDHPDPCWGYRFEHEGKAYSHCVDTEAVRVSRQEMGPDLPLYQNVDLMVFDAQYTLMETIEKVHWGHAAASIGLDIALREGIRRIIFMHHDPAAGDERIYNVEQQTRRYYERMVKHMREAGEPVVDVEWSFAIEGIEIEV